jgi:hypothetical protein
MRFDVDARRRKLRPFCTASPKFLEPPRGENEKLILNGKHTTIP